METFEKRYVTELRANTETSIVEGTAIVFNSESELMGGQFREVILPEAAPEEFLNKQDIVMLYNHNEDYGVLARYSPNAQRNSLHFSVDERGVHFNFKVKKKDAGILESIADGDLKACSFSFRLSEGGDVWEKNPDGTYLRTIKKFDAVRDFSIVVNPAYQATEVNTRGLDELKQEEEVNIQKEKELKEQQEKVERLKKLQDYYKTLRRKYLSK